MRRCIWKFPLDVTDVQHVIVPTGATPLSVQLQDADLYMWAEVDADADSHSTLIVRIFGTGTKIDIPKADRRFLGTIQQRGYVWHVFVSTS